jgi:succinate dehydrogenase/fumarate reductase flavoprotein subunit
MQGNTKILSTDVLVIGSEGAGARAALEATECGCHITKARLGKSGATQCAPGDFALNSNSALKLGMDGDERDSWELHFEDTLEGGKRLNDVAMARIMTEGAEDAMAYLMELGVPWSRLGFYPGHRYPRGAMVGTVGKTGTSLLQGLHKAVKRRKITVLEDTFAIELLTDKGIVSGCIVLYVPSGELLIIQAKVVILATGGGSRIYWLTSGPEEVTGDGMAMAFRAGAELIDMEFVQFSPYTMIWPQGLRGHQSFVYEYFCVLNSWLMNCYGDRFMSKWDSERMEHSTRDTLSIAMMSEILAGNGSEHDGVYLSVTHLPKNLLEHFAEDYFPGLQVGSFHLREFGVDPQHVAFEVAPGAHFFMGGVRVDTNCATTLPGLYACGEVSGGAHGANRLSGNALTETQVFGAIAGCKAAEFALNRANTTIEIDQNQVDSVRERIRLMSGSDEGLCPFVLREQLQQLAWRQVGVIRDQKGLENALSTLKDWETSALPRIRIKTKTNVFNVELVKALEFENMLQVLKAITISALSRSESCGAHYRTDSIPDSSVPVRYVIQRNEQRMELSSVTVEADIV